MNERLNRDVLLRKTARAASIFSVAALLAAPAWAQRGRAGGPPMRMPSMPAPMPMPRMSPPMRQTPMPGPMPPMRPPENMPRYNPAPRPVFHAPIPERMPNPGRRGKFGPRSGPIGPPRGYMPTRAEGIRMPVYTPMTSNAYRARVAAMRAYQNQLGMSAYTFPAYLTGYAWNPFFFGFGDPFDFAFFSGTGCSGLSPFSSLTFNPYSAGFAYPPFANPLFGPGLFCGDPFSPAYFQSSASFCPLCGSFGFDTFALGLNNAGFLDPLSALAPSSSFSPAGGFAGSWNTQGSSALAYDGFAGTSPPDSFSATALSSSEFATNQPASGDRVTLVFTNGSTMDATQYWLGNKGNFHYVTSSGQAVTVPLAELDMPATMAANRRKGVQFLTPSSAGSARQRKP